MTRRKSKSKMTRRKSNKYRVSNKCSGRKISRRKSNSMLRFKYRNTGNVKYIYYRKLST